MPVEEYAVSAEDAVVKVSQLLSRADVRRVVLQDLEGTTLLEVAGTTDPSLGARQVMESFDEPEGATTTLKVLAETGGLRRTETGTEGLETRSESDLDREVPLERPDSGGSGPHGI